MEAFNKGDVGVNLDGVHGRIHQGQFFLASEFNIVSGGATFNYLISTNNSSAHFSFDITTNSDINITLRKQVVASAIGTPLDGLSVNDFSTIEPQTVITTDATLSDTGSEWECILLIADPGKSGTTQIAASRVEEFVLKTNDFYAIEIINMGMTEIDICTRLGWYEPAV